MMKNSYLLIGIRSSHLFKILIKNGFSVYRLNRILFLVQNALFSSFLYRREKRKFYQHVNQVNLPADPVFIVGHWRTGSTFLHQLISQDENFCFPTLLQCAQPDHFLYSKKFFEPVMKKVLGKSRPMDNVKLGVDEPQEDEYAIMKLVSPTPLEKLVFPEKNSYLVANAETSVFSENKTMFDDKYCWFLKKVMFLNPGKKLVSKNPMHSYRIEYLKTKFPHAKFIHIIRHPFKVVPSAKHLWEIVGKQNTLKNFWYKPTYSEIAREYARLTEKIFEKTSDLEPERFVEIKYEDLEKNPVLVVKELYKKLNLTFTKQFEAVLSNYLNGLAGYKKNSFVLSEEDKLNIKSEMKDFMVKYNYNDD